MFIFHLFIYFQMFIKNLKLNFLQVNNKVSKELSELSKSLGCRLQGLSVFLLLNIMVPKHSELIQIIKLCWTQFCLWSIWIHVVICDIQQFSDILATQLPFLLFSLLRVSNPEINVFTLCFYGGQIGCQIFKNVHYLFQMYHSLISLIPKMVSNTYFHHFIRLSFQNAGHLFFFYSSLIKSWITLQILKLIYCSFFNMASKMSSKSLKMLTGQCFQMVTYSIKCA